MLLYTFGLTIYFIVIWNEVSLLVVLELRCQYTLFYIYKVCKVYKVYKVYRVHKVNYFDNTSDFVSRNDFDGIEAISEQI